MKSVLLAAPLLIAQVFTSLCLAQTPPPAPAAAAKAPEIAVDMRNLSEPVLCAEKDNIRVDFASPDVRSFRIQAQHPAYIGTISTDRWAPDFTSCDMSSDSVFTSDAAKPKRVTFWETPEYWLTGYVFPSFWRPNNVPIKVGDGNGQSFHLIQLWKLHRERAEEVLVLYPPDGYWRARPLPFGDMRWTAYGSSFLVGPVETQQRPIVALKDIAFDPATMTFTLNFVRGGSAKVHIDKIDQDHLGLDVAFDRAMPDNLPFASLRSMYITETNSDVARVQWRGKDATHWGESTIMDFKGAQAMELWAGRTVPSRHNLSAPDMVFQSFRATMGK
jgi:hypothetical protein